METVTEEATSAEMNAILDEFENEMTSVFHKGGLNNGIVSSTRTLSTGTNRAAVEALERQGQVWEFRLPKISIARWKFDGLVESFTDFDNATSTYNQELRFSPKLAPQMNNYLIKP